MQTTVVNRTVVLNPNRTQKEQLFICEALHVVNASTSEFQQFYLMNEWVMKFSAVTWNVQQTLINFLNQTVQRARSFRPQKPYYSLSLRTSSKTLVLSCLKRGRLTNTTNSSNQTVNLLDSSSLRIDFQQVVVNISTNGSISTLTTNLVNFTFYMGTGSSRSSVRLNLNTSSLLKDIKNG